MLLLITSMSTELSAISELGNSAFGLLLIFCVSLCILNEKITKLLKRIKKLNKLLKKISKVQKDKTNKR